MILNHEILGQRFEALRFVTYSVHIFSSFQQLLHVEFDMTWLKLYTLILQKTRQIMIHVGKHHVHREWVFLSTWREDQ